MSGKVTYKGQMVPAGQVVVIPGKDDEGKQPYPQIAPIKDGMYDTRTSPGGKGFSSGQVQVRIAGYTGKQTKYEEPLGDPIFPEYTTELELPKVDLQKDFEVPASTPKGQ